MKSPEKQGWWWGAEGQCSIHKQHTHSESMCALSGQCSFTFLFFGGGFVFQALGTRLLQ